MSEALRIARDKQVSKLARQVANAQATEAEIAVLGETPRLVHNLERQLAAVKETEGNIKKLDAAIKKS